MEGARVSELTVRRLDPAEVKSSASVRATRCTHCSSRFEWVAERPGTFLIYWCPECDNPPIIPPSPRRQAK
jgi:hypothetical protein